MAKATVIHSEDAAKIIFRGDKSKPEPSLGVIEFPGGHVEVSRCSDGSYYAHINVINSAHVIASRINYDHGKYAQRIDAGQAPVPPINDMENINQIAVRISTQGVQQ